MTDSDEMLFLERAICNVVCMLVRMDEKILHNGNVPLIPRTARESPRAPAGAQDERVVEIMREFLCWRCDLRLCALLFRCSQILWR